jgi:SAM-dependent methyltransferase
MKGTHVSTTEPALDTASADALAGRLFEATIAAMDLFSVYLGDRLGYYRDLAANGPATSLTLAERTATAERYAREWLEHQAVTGILAVENADEGPTERRYSLPAGYEAVLADPTSLLAMAPLAQIFAGCVRPLPALLDAYRTGGGVPFEDYGADLAEGQAGTTYPQFLHLLAQEWIPAMPDIHARLRDAGRPARIADIGMGLGWSSIALARAFPHIRVDGFDVDEASVAAACANAEAEGLADRVRFHAVDAGVAEPAGGYDFALAVECVHDMPDPVSVLRSMRRLVGDGGSVLIVDEKVAERFQVPGDDVERYMYGFSILHCLPVGMVEQPSAATGTVMRADTLADYAARAGFQRVDVLPIEHDFFRFYRLTA